MSDLYRRIDFEGGSLPSGGVASADLISRLSEHATVSGFMSTFSTAKNGGNVESSWLRADRPNNRFFIGRYTGPDQQRVLDQTFYGKQRPGESINHVSTLLRNDPRVTMYAPNLVLQGRDAVSGSTGSLINQGHATSIASRGDIMHSKVLISEGRHETLAGFMTANSSDRSFTAQHNRFRLFSSTDHPQEVAELKAIAAYSEGRRLPNGQLAPRPRAGSGAGQMRHFELTGPGGDNPRDRAVADIYALAKERGGDIYVQSANFEDKAYGDALAVAGKAGVHVHLALNQRENYGKYQALQGPIALARSTVAHGGGNVDVRTIAVAADGTGHHHANIIAIRHKDGRASLPHLGSARLKTDFVVPGAPGNSSTDLVYHAEGAEAEADVAQTEQEFKGYARDTSFKYDAHKRAPHNEFLAHYAPSSAGEGSGFKQIHYTLDFEATHGATNQAVEAVYQRGDKTYAAYLQDFERAPGMMTALYQAAAEEFGAGRPMPGAGDANLARLLEIDQALKRRSWGQSEMWAGMHLPEYLGGGPQLGTRGFFDSTLMRFARYWDKQLASMTRYGDGTDPMDPTGGEGPLSKTMDFALTFGEDLIYSTAAYHVIGRPAMRASARLRGGVSTWADKGLRSQNVLRRHRFAAWALKGFSGMGHDATRMYLDLARPGLDAVSPLLERLTGQSLSNVLDVIAKNHEGPGLQKAFSETMIKDMDVLDELHFRLPILSMLSSKGALGSVFAHVLNPYTLGVAAVNGVKYVYARARDMMAGGLGNEVQAELGNIEAGGGDMAARFEAKRAYIQGLGTRGRRLLGERVADVFTLDGRDLSPADETTLMSQYATDKAKLATATAAGQTSTVSQADLDDLNGRLRTSRDRVSTRRTTLTSLETSGQWTRTRAQSARIASAWNGMMNNFYGFTGESRTAAEMFRAAPGRVRGRQAALGAVILWGAERLYGAMAAASGASVGQQVEGMNIGNRQLPGDRRLRADYVPAAMSSAGHTWGWWNPITQVGSMVQYALSTVQAGWTNFWRPNALPGENLQQMGAAGFGGIQAGKMAGDLNALGGDPVLEGLLNSKQHFLDPNHQDLNAGSYVSVSQKLGLQGLMAIGFSWSSMNGKETLGYSLNLPVQVRGGFRVDLPFGRAPVDNPNDPYHPTMEWGWINNTSGEELFLGTVGLGMAGQAGMDTYRTIRGAFAGWQKAWWRPEFKGFDAMFPGLGMTEDFFDPMAETPWVEHTASTIRKTHKELKWFTNLIPKTLSYGLSRAYQTVPRVALALMGAGWGDLGTALDHPFPDARAARVDAVVSQALVDLPQGGMRYGFLKGPVGNVARWLVRKQPFSPYAAEAHRKQTALDALHGNATPNHELQAFERTLQGRALTSGAVGRGARRAGYLGLFAMAGFALMAPGTATAFVGSVNEFGARLPDFGRKHGGSVGYWLGQGVHVATSLFSDSLSIGHATHNEGNPGDGGYAGAMMGTLTNKVAKETGHEGTAVNMVTNALLSHLSGVFFKDPHISAENAYEPWGVVGDIRMHVGDTSTMTAAYVAWKEFPGIASLTVSSGASMIKENANAKALTDATNLQLGTGNPMAFMARQLRMKHQKSATMGVMFHEDAGLNTLSTGGQMEMARRRELSSWVLTNNNGFETENYFFFDRNKGGTNFDKYLPGHYATGLDFLIYKAGHYLTGDGSLKTFAARMDYARSSSMDGGVGEVDFGYDSGEDLNGGYNAPKGTALGDLHKKGLAHYFDDAKPWLLTATAVGVGAVTLAAAGTRFSWDPRHLYHDPSLRRTAGQLLRGERSHMYMETHGVTTMGDSTGLVIGAGPLAKGAFLQHSAAHRFFLTSFGGSLRTFGGLPANLIDALYTQHQVGPALAASSRAAGLLPNFVVDQTLAFNATKASFKKGLNSALAANHATDIIKRLGEHTQYLAEVKKMLPLGVVDTQNKLAQLETFTDQLTSQTSGNNPMRDRQLEAARGLKGVYETRIQTFQTADNRLFGSRVEEVLGGIREGQLGRFATAQELLHAELSSALESVKTANPALKDGEWTELEKHFGAKTPELDALFNKVTAGLDPLERGKLQGMGLASLTTELFTRTADIAHETFQVNEGGGDIWEGGGHAVAKNSKMLTLGGFSGNTTSIMFENWMDGVQGALNAPKPGGSWAAVKNQYTLSVEKAHVNNILRGLNYSATQVSEIQSTLEGAYQAAMNGNTGPVPGKFQVTQDALGRDLSVLGIMDNTAFTGLNNEITARIDAGRKPTLGVQLRAVTGAGLEVGGSRLWGGLKFLGRLVQPGLMAANTMRGSSGGTLLAIGADESLDDDSRAEAIGAYHSTGGIALKGLADNLAFGVATGGTARLAAYTQPWLRPGAGETRVPFKGLSAYTKANAPTPSPVVRPSGGGLRSQFKAAMASRGKVGVAASLLVGATAGLAYFAFDGNAKDSAVMGARWAIDAGSWAATGWGFYQGSKAVVGGALDAGIGAATRTIGTTGMQALKTTAQWAIRVGEAGELGADVTAFGSALWAGAGVLLTIAAGLATWEVAVGLAAATAIYAVGTWTNDRWHWYDKAMNLIPDTAEEHNEASQKLGGVRFLDRLGNFGNYLMNTGISSRLRDWGWEKSHSPKSGWFMQGLGSFVNTVGEAFNPVAGTGAVNQFNTAGMAGQGTSLSSHPEMWYLPDGGGSAAFAMTMTPLWHGNMGDAVRAALDNQQAVRYGSVTQALSDMYSPEQLGQPSGPAAASYMHSATTQEGSFMATSFGGIAPDEALMTMMRSRVLAGQFMTEQLEESNHGKIWAGSGRDAKVVYSGYSGSEFSARPDRTVRFSGLMGWVQGGIKAFGAGANRNSGGRGVVGPDVSSYQQGGPAEVWASSGSIALAAQEATRANFKVSGACYRTAAFTASLLGGNLRSAKSILTSRFKELSQLQTDIDAGILRPGMAVYMNLRPGTDPNSVHTGRNYAGPDNKPHWMTYAGNGRFTDQYGTYSAAGVVASYANRGDHRIIDGYFDSGIRQGTEPGYIGKTFARLGNWATSFGVTPGAKLDGDLKVTLKRTQAYHADIMTQSRKKGVDPLLSMSVLAAESVGDPNATSPTGARGLMQVQPEYHTGRAIKRTGSSNLYDPHVSIVTGIDYLAEIQGHMRARYPRATQDQITQLTAAGYNAGEGAVLRAGGIPGIAETQAYAPKVLKYYQQLQAASAAPSMHPSASSHPPATPHPASTLRPTKRPTATPSPYPTATPTMAPSAHPSLRPSPVATLTPTFYEVSGEGSWTPNPVQTQHPHGHPAPAVSHAPSPHPTTTPDLWKAGGPGVSGSGSWNTDSVRLHAPAPTAGEAVAVSADARFYAAHIDPSKATFHMVRGWGQEDKAFHDHSGGVYTSGPMFDGWMASDRGTVHAMGDVYSDGQLTRSPNRAAAQQRAYVGFNNQTGKAEFGYGEFKEGMQGRYNAFVGGLYSIYNDTQSKPDSYKDPYATSLSQRVHFQMPRPRMVFGLKSDGTFEVLETKGRMLMPQVEAEARRRGYVAAYMPDHGTKSRFIVPGKKAEPGDSDSLVPYLLHFTALVPQVREAAAKAVKAPESKTPTTVKVSATVVASQTVPVGTDPHVPVTQARDQVNVCYDPEKMQLMAHASYPDGTPWTALSDNHWAPVEQMGVDNHMIASLFG